MAVRRKDLEEKLVHKFGFEAVEGKKHDAFSLFVNGQKVASTRFSRGHDEINDAIQTLMARQIGVQQLGFFKQMYLCTKSRDDYLDLLRKAGKIL